MLLYFMCFREALKRDPMMQRDASLSDSYTFNCCCFSGMIYFDQLDKCYAIRFQWKETLTARNYASYK